MKPEIRDLWADALASGDYPQGSNYLCSDGKFCCWGVLADLAVKAGVIPDPVNVHTFLPEHEVLSYGTAENNSVHSRQYLSRFPAKEVLEWAGIEPPTDSFDDSSLVHKMTGFNDGCSYPSYKEKKSFKWIAAYIRRYL